MTKLTDDIKLYIVQQLACHNSPSQVADDVYEEFGIKLERTHIQRYDPTKVAGKQLGKKLKEIFEATRESFLNDISKIPIASKSVRLNELSISHKYFKSKKNFIAANQVLEQVAKEVGNMYTNKISLNSESENPFIAFYNQICGTSLPAVADVDCDYEEVKDLEESPKEYKKIKWVTSGSK